MSKRRNISEKTASAPTAVRRLANDMAIWQYKINEGLNNAQIAERTGMTPDSVSKAMNRIFNTYRAQLTGEVEAQAGILAARYELLYTEAMSAWERSKAQDRRVTRTIGRRRAAGQTPEAAAKDNGESETTTVSQADRDGNPVFLDTAMKALKQLQSMLGLDAPIQVQAQVSGRIQQDHQHQHNVQGVIGLRREIDTSLFDDEQMRNYLQELGTAALQFAQTTMLPPAHEAAQEAARAAGAQPVIIDQESGAIATSQPTPAPPASPLPTPQTTESDQ